MVEVMSTEPIRLEGISWRGIYALRCDESNGKGIEKIR